MSKEIRREEQKYMNIRNPINALVTPLVSVEANLLPPMYILLGRASQYTYMYKVFKKIPHYILGIGMLIVGTTVIVFKL